MTEVHSQTTTASPTEVSTQPVDTPVTAAAPSGVVDNATLTSEQIQSTASPQQAADGPTGEGVDALSSYADRMAAFLSNPDAPLPGAAVVTTEAAPATAQTQTTAAPVVPNPDPEDDVPLIKDGVMPKMRVRTVTPVDVQAVAEFQASQRAGNTQSLVEFIAERYVPKAAPTTTEAVPAVTAPPVDSLAAITAEIEQLEAERDTLNEAFEFDQAKDLKPKIAELRAKERELLTQSKESQSEAVNAQAAAEQEYLVKAAKAFPQSVQADSPLAMQARAIHAQWVADKDPRGQHPSGLYYCYVEAADTLGISPGQVAPAPTQQPSTPPPVNRPPVSALIAGGDARSQQTRAPALPGKTYQERLAAHLAATSA